jgi:DNA-binding NarL/FixJ family response regulator
MQRVIPAKVLVIEDQPTTAAGLREELNAQGYLVTGVACSGEEALGSIEKSPPDLVIVGSHFRRQPAGQEIAEVVRSLCNIPVTLSDSVDGAQPSPTAAGHETLAKREKSFWLSTALNSAADGIVMVDREGCVRS